MKNEILEIIKNHQHYLSRDVDGWENMRADLSNADLRDAVLTDADLRYANLEGADLSNANLWGSNLRHADLGRANLQGAKLKEVDFEDADLHLARLCYVNLQKATLANADLHSADLRGADLRGADLRGANLTGANLTGARLIKADLFGADLRGADLGRTNFEYANLHCAELDEDEEFRKGVILTESIIGWKQCLTDGRRTAIVELEIPKWSVMFGINGKKFRTNRARVLSISEGEVAHSFYCDSFIYEVGKEIEVKDFDMSYNVECSNGIHFFKNREDAEKY